MDFDDPGFRELIDALHDGVYITDADGITLKVNSRRSLWSRPRRWASTPPVSYTHLTLPTICSV